MVIDRRWRTLAAASLFLAGGGVLAADAPPTLDPAVEREVVAPQGSAFQPAPADEAAAMGRFAAYTMALAHRDYAAAYAMRGLSLQASSPRLEWEMNLRKREAIWADGTIRILRLRWYLDPEGQPPGVYAAFDFRGDRAGDWMDCGYVVVHRPSPGAQFAVSSSSVSEVPSELMEDGVPKADVLRQLPCYLGKGIATAF